MDALTSLKKGKDISVGFAKRALRNILDVMLAVLAYIYLNVLLLGLSSHPRIAHRSFNVDNSHKLECPQFNGTWDKFVKFILSDCKLAAGLCAWMLLSIGVVSAVTYHSDPVICQITLVAILPPAIGIAQLSCIVWHLKSTHECIGAPFYWNEVTIFNARSPFIRTTALLAAPVAWTLWSVMSFIMILFVILVRGLPIPPYDDFIIPISSENWIIETFVTIFSCQAGESTQGLIILSIASRVCASAILAVGCLHLGITALYFTKLCLPREAPITQDIPKTSPIDYSSCSSPYSPSTSPSSSSLHFPDAATQLPSPTEIAFPPPLIISTNTSYSASSTPSPSPESGLYVSPFAEYFPSPTSTLYAPSPIMSSPQAGKSPPADTTQFPARVVLKRPSVAAWQPSASL